MSNAPVPMSMRSLPVDPDRTYFHVPWFVAWINGKPDYRVIAPGKIIQAVKGDLCWLCGQQIGPAKAFVIGPMCSLNRTSAEPPCHVECAEYAVQVCPFMTRPQMKRNEKDLPANKKEMPGFGLKRNPGVVLVWQTRSYMPFRATAGEAGILFELGDPLAVSFWAEGRLATREEVLASIDSGLPLLAEMAIEDPLPGAMDELNRRYEAACALLPASHVSAVGAQP